MNDIAFSVVIKNDGISDIIFKTIMLKGDKGNSVSRVEKTSTSGLVDTYTIYLTDGTVGGTFTVTNGNDINIDDTAVSYSKTWSSQKIKNELDELSSDVSEDIDTLSGMIPQTDTIEDVAIASFSDGADDVPVSELIVDIVPFQAGSGDASPENERPISGWTECNVAIDGKNLIDGHNLKQGLPNNSIGSDWDNIISTTRYAYYDIYLGNGTYTISLSNPLSKFNYLSCYSYKGNKMILINFSFNPNDNNTRTFTINDADKFRIIFGVISGDAMPTDVFDVCDDFQFELGSTATDYEAYNGDTATIDFDGNTVFGGYLNVLTGELTITDVSNMVNGDSNVVPNGITARSSHFFYTPTPTKKFGLANFISDKFARLVADYVYSISGREANSGVEFCLPTDVPQTATAGKEWFSDNPTMLVYELNEPQTIQLTPVQVKTLLKNNNIFADTGNIEKLVYFKAGSEAVAKLIEAYMRGNAEPEE